jgi:uncharacterized membrane protein required for colicin V production
MSAFVDFAIVLFVLGAARSGWRRGLVFYLIDLVGFVASVLIAIRFHEIPAIGFDFIGLSETWAAFLGGLVIFVPLIVFTAIVGSRAAGAVYKPGLFTTNRALGAALAATFAVVAAIVGLLFLRAAPIPFGLGDLIKRSTIAPAVIGWAEPVIAFADDAMELELCGGNLADIIPEVCETPAKLPSDATEETTRPETRRTPQG